MSDGRECCSCASPSRAQTRLRGPGNCDHARIENLPRAAEGHLGRSALAMHCHHAGPLMPLVMLVPVDAASLLDQPLAECRTFHGSCSVNHIDPLDASNCAARTWPEFKILDQLALLPLI